MEIRLRRAEESDAHLLFRWRSEPEAARNSLNNNPLEWIEHKAWFDDSLKNPNRHIMIGVPEEGHPFGMVRLDWLPHLSAGEFEVSINIDPKLRGRGLGKSLLKETIKLYPGYSFMATIRDKNVASLIIFLASGFELVAYNPRMGLVFLKKEPK